MITITLLMMITTYIHTSDYNHDNNNKHYITSNDINDNIGTH